VTEERASAHREAGVDKQLPVADLPNDSSGAPVMFVVDADKPQSPEERSAMSATTEHPKVFISYSWSGPEHEEFVVELAKALRGHGVDVILDKWRLKAGQDKHVFMESMVVDPEVVRVLVICDRKYQAKANARAGGVGTESEIISAEVYGKVNQTKFIPVVREFDASGQPCVPVFMKGRIYVDISSDEKYGDALDELLRLIYEQPFHQEPKLGAPPDFVTNSGAAHVRELTSALRAIRDGKPTRQGLEAQYVRALMVELNKLYVQPDGNEFDEGIYQAILATKPLRNQLDEYVEAVSAFSNDDPSSLAPFIRLMNDLGGHFGPPQGKSTFIPAWSDLYAFFALEAMLLQTAALLRHDRWKSLRRLLSAAYLVADTRGEAKATTFVSFDRELDSLDKHRNRRLQLNRASVSADTLRERCGQDSTTFSEVMQADVMLTLASMVRLGGDAGEGWLPYWAPRTSVFAPYGNKHPVFMRAIEEETRAGIRLATGAAAAADLAAKMAAAEAKLQGFGRLAGNALFGQFNLVQAVNLTELVK
jgi:hypothetical protein